MTREAAVERPGLPVVLVFSRAYIADEFRDNVSPLKDEFDFRFLCDGKKPGTEDTRARFYHYWGNRVDFPGLSEKEIEDVISRCRLLRNLHRSDALRMLHAMAHTLHEYFEANKPDLVLSHLVDEYITHLVSILAARRGIRYIAYVYSYFSGYVQVLEGRDGSPLKFRTPSAEESAAICAKYSVGDFRQDYAQRPKGTRFRQFKGILRYNLKLAYFRLMRLIENDPLNMHYLITPYVAEHRRMSDLPDSDVFAADWRTRLVSARGNGQTTLFMPLAFFPEAAIDYWVNDTSIIDYEAKTIEIVGILAQSYCVVIKEHPHMVGSRNPAFYDRLKGIANVLMVPPDEHGTSLIVLTDATIVGAGSAGVEAGLRNKPVFTYCDTSYWFEESGSVFLPLSRTSEWPEMIANALPGMGRAGPQDALRLAFECLRSTAHQRPSDGRWPLCDPSDLRNALSAGLSGVQGTQGAVASDPSSSLSGMPDFSCAAPSPLNTHSAT